MASRVTMRNKAAVRARLARIPKAIKDPVARRLDTEVEEIVEAIRRAAPVDETADNPGQLRDSVVAYRNRNRAMSYRILADAKDEDGKFIGSHVEHGHKARDGSHVPPQPFFYPTYRARKKGAQRRLKATARKAIKQTFPG